MKDAFYNRLIIASGFIGAFGVIAGAFGAHFLKSRLGETDLTTIKTGVLYLFVHVIGLVLIGIIGQVSTSSGWLKYAGISFIVGILFFSGSLFIIGTSTLTGFPVSAIGPITPVGGILFITGWIALAVNGIRKRPTR